MEYILGIIGLLLGGVGYLFVKKQSAEALLSNTETKEKIVALDREAIKLKVSAEIEELRRELERKQADERKRNPIDPRDFQ